MTQNHEKTPGWLRALDEADWAVLLPHGGGPMPFRLLQAGEFQMGSRGFYSDEEPRHWVKIPQAFCVAAFPVTQRQFASWSRDQGVEHENGFADQDTDGFDPLLRPAENMDWDQATQFCSWLSEIEGLPQGYRAHLMTESQWEYACRAGSETEYAHGDGRAALEAMGWFDGNSKRSTHPVGQKAPNAWGLYDMHGNVWEWCQDVFDGEAYRKRLDGEVQETSQRGLPNRILRGGSWNFSAGFCRSACRFMIHPGRRVRTQGFRVCLLPGPVAQASQPEAEGKEGAGEGGGTPDDQATDAPGASLFPKPFQEAKLPPWPLQP